MKTLKAFVYFLLLTGSIFAQTEKPIKWRKVHVLVYTKNGKGFVHDNIPFAAKSWI
ncbi:MAG: hypothetical protein MUE81_21735 [Thermoflexibacter sp.]|nr:hypothetical protein [Thermoflexibacter sp.]